MEMCLNRWWRCAPALAWLPVLVCACIGPTRARDVGGVQIDAVDVQTLESFPIQVVVAIRGTLVDACTDIERVDQHVDADKNLFSIEITTRVRTDDDCGLSPVPFEEVVDLDVYGLPAGGYVVNVHGTKETFSLPTDNVPPAAGVPNPASVYCQDRGYWLEIRTDKEGNQIGICIFPDGSECDEWAFFRGDCGPAD